jgi:hypothetical protein
MKNIFFLYVELSHICTKSNIMQKYSTLVISFFLILFNSVANDTTKIENKSIVISNQKVFANIYTGFYYGFNEEIKPTSGFALTTGLFGYSSQISEDVSAKIIFDVTRTTNDFVITDTAGNQYNVSYFEGSKFTAFLKMAEIKWRISENVDLKVGQLLSTQYLTFLDKFWGYRYVDVTFNEKYRFGAPADFGVQLDFKDKYFLNSFSVVNGEGPFRHQDESGKFLIANNLQVYPINGLTIKLYVDYAKQPSDTTGRAKSSISAFIGYKHETFKVGLEYNYVQNYSYVESLNFSGTSLYGSYVIDEKAELIGRWDHITESLYIKDGDYIIAGYQYQPAKNLFTSINIRHLTTGSDTKLFFNFGVKF